MTSTLATRQRLLTRSGNRLSAIMQEESETINAYVYSSMEAAEISALRKRIRTAKTAIVTEANKLEAAMEKFSEAVDRLDNKRQSLPEIIERHETNTTAAQTLLDHAKRALTRLIRLQEELEFDQEQRSLNRCEVSGSTYQLVIEQLKEKYGDKQALIDQLLKNLHGARARTDSLKDQEPLCEQLHSITSQLTLKREHVDNVFLQMELLAKFSVDVQGHILRQRTQLKNEGNWSTAALLSAAKQHIKTELKINRQVEHSLGSGKMEKTNAGKKEYFSKTEVVPRVALCFYCHKSGHPAKGCDEVTSREQRVQIKRMQNFCHNCGGKDHWATKCKGTCRICIQAGHHTSICKELFSSQKARKASTPRNAVFRVSNTTKVLILAGQARALNPTTKALEPVYVILDTGADRSFISSSLAERLQLKDLDSSRLSIGTFGAHKPFERTCGITVLHMWDAEKVPHTFTVTKIDTITKPLTRSRLSQEDKQFLFENDIHLSINHTVEKIQPDILLGCADLFSLLKDGPGAQTTFPSGLKAILSRLGYLISGRSGEELVNSESSTWEQFCEFEKSGVKEFSGPITEELKQTNAEAWKAFEETIEKKEDGYYVRLPWKKEASGIPDNKSIAYRRLQANLSKLRNDPNLLQQYDDTIKSQLELGIIEEIAEDLIVQEGEVVHYLAH
ncbi:zinc knuckle [Necator americanus]|uniref:Zinc knuckle n=1 Tax=Necator americanus TaxID=51031 RepID=W2SYT8_NECAM|nr:zinc knuckle [Necator americanus]ETN74111.1 zinc knuckle [Necator americanus]